MPNCAAATATFASPPPKVATNCGDCRKRSKPGGASRSIVSPNEMRRAIKEKDSRAHHLKQAACTMNGGMSSNLTRRQALAGLAGAALRPHLRAAAAKTPNIIFILCDDLGYEIGRAHGSTPLTSLYPV